MRIPSVLPFRETIADLLGKAVLAASMTLLAGLLTGCGTTQTTGNAPAAVNGVEEYRQLSADASAEVLRALVCLDRVARQTNTCPPKVMTAFAQEVERLQVESIRVRARAQAIQARGDAYFEAWTNNLTPTNGPPIDQVAEHLPQMQKSFLKIKQASQQAGTSFRPFLSGLRKLQTALEGNADALETVDGKELIRTTREYGHQVVQSLGVITNELQVLARWYKPAKPAANL